MIKSTRKILRIFKIVFKNAYIRDSKIPGFILSSTINQLLDIFISLILFNIIFSDTKTLAGWNFYQVLFLYAFAKFITTAHQVISKGGVRSLATDLVRLGDYDFYLTKPVNPMAFVSISKPRLYSIFPLFFEIGLMIYATTHSGIVVTAASFVWFIILTLFSLTLFYFLYIITIIPAFWLTRLSSILAFMDRMVQFTRYPSGVFSGVLRTLLSTLFPIIVVAYFPVTTFFYTPRFSYIIYMILVTIIFYFITTKLWRIGEKNYGSASS